MLRKMLVAQELSSASLIIMQNTPKLHSCTNKTAITASGLGDCVASDGSANRNISIRVMVTHCTANSAMKVCIKRLCMAYIDSNPYTKIISQAMPMVAIKNPCSNEACVSKNKRMKTAVSGSATRSKSLNCAPRGSMSCGLARKIKISNNVLIDGGMILNTDNSCRR